MNNKQRTALIFGILVIVVMGIFPPYTDTSDGTGGYQFLFLKWAEEKPILSGLPPDASQEVWNEREKTIKEWTEHYQERLRRQLDWHMLLIQWVIAAGITGAFLVGLSNPFCADAVNLTRRFLRAARRDDQE